MAEAAVILDLKGKLKKSIQYSTTQCRVPELIAVLGSQPAGNMSHIINPVVGCHYFLPGPQLPSQPLRELLPILLLVCLRLLPDSITAAI